VSPYIWFIVQVEQQVKRVQVPLEQTGADVHRLGCAQVKAVSVGSTVHCVH